MSLQSFFKELFQIFLLDIRCGDCERLHRKQSCPRCQSHVAHRPSSLHFDGLRSSSHFASNVSWATRHTLLWRLSSTPKYCEATHRRSCCNGVSLASNNSPHCLSKYPSSYLNRPALLSSFLAAQSTVMCRWNPDSQHPFRRCTHGHWHHEELPMLERTTDIPAIWCNKCWTLCAFESRERVVPRPFALLFDMKRLVTREDKRPPRPTPGTRNNLPDINQYFNAESLPDPPRRNTAAQGDYFNMGEKKE